MNEPPKRILHFTLGPVQEFIAEARRTRDFWAGSFILSLLSGHAMVALKKAGGEIIFPSVEGDDLFETLAGSRTAEPYIGSLPNRFKADITGVKGDAGRLCREAVDKAWHLLSDAVWEEVVKPHVNNAKGGEAACRAIWDRQVDGFWETAWVAGDEPADTSDLAWLDIRKNLRRHGLGAAQAEGGDHCRLMGRYQEISGFQRTKERGPQQTFWRALSKGSELDLRPDERLCAIALIKRFFPVLAEEQLPKAFMPFKPGGAKLNIRHWPSTSYIAAVPWLKQVPPEAGQAYFDIVKDHVDRKFRGETETKLYGFKGPFFTLDGHLLHRDGIISYVKERFPDDQEERDKVLKALDGGYGALEKAVEKAQARKHPSEFYAILRMDGDQIGPKLAEHSDVILTALARFTRSVGDYFDPAVNKCLGALIYAGGDDVLALLPVDTAMTAARDLQRKYAEAFKKSGASDGKFTISASIVYSHFHNPLSAALRYSVKVLDEDAKDKNGRDTLAVAVLKPGGVAAEWMSTFGDEESAVESFAHLASSQGATKTELSGGFFHALRQRYEPLFTNIDGQAAALGDADDALLNAVITAQVNQQFSGGPAFDDRPDLIKHIVKMLRPSRRGEHGEKTGAPGVAFKGGLIVRFLRTESRPGGEQQGEKKS